MQLHLQKKIKEFASTPGGKVADGVSLIAIAGIATLATGAATAGLAGGIALGGYDRHPELQSKWDKAFWAIGYYVETIGNITDEAVQKYIKEQAEESRKEDSRSTAL
nr:transposase [Robinsoniella sp. KNHs210]